MPALNYSDDDDVSPVPSSNRRATAPPPPSVLASGSKKPRLSPTAADAVPSASTSVPKKRKTRIAPVIPPKKPTQYELFGTDSEDETDEPRAQQHGNNLDSYLILRCSNAFSRQERSTPENIISSLKSIAQITARSSVKIRT